MSHPMTDAQFEQAYLLAWGRALLVDDAQPIAAASPTEGRDTAESGTVVPTTDAP